MPGETITEVQRTTTQRILLDQPVEAVWKRIGDLRTFADPVRVVDVTPNGDTVRAEWFRTVAPYRVCFVGTGAVVARDDDTRRTIVRIEARDRFGRGRIDVTAAFDVAAVGGGTEVVLTVDAVLAGAIVRATGDALLADLGAVVDTCFVALAGDGFVPEPMGTTEFLFDMPVYGLLDTSVPERALEPAPEIDAEPEPEIDLVALERTPAAAFDRFVGALQAHRPVPDVIDLTDAGRPVMLATSAIAPSASFASFLATVPSVDLVFESAPHDEHDPHVLHFDPEPLNVFARAALVEPPSAPSPEVPVVTDPVDEPAVADPSTGPAARVAPSPSASAPVRPARGPAGLPAVSLPRRRGLGTLRSRAAKATQTVGTVAAGAAVVAAVAGAVVARRWLGRR